jgi:TonB family protein
VSARGTPRYGTGMLLAAGLLLLVPAASWSQQTELARKVKSKVLPTYPELARRMGIAGVVKIAVVVAPNGAVKSSKLVGGHPVLAPAALDAIRRWRFEPAATESSGVIEFKFDPSAGEE